MISFGQVAVSGPGRSQESDRKGRERCGGCRFLFCSVATACKRELPGMVLLTARPLPRSPPVNMAMSTRRTVKKGQAEKQDPSSLKVLLSVRSLLFNYPTEQSMEKMIMKVKNTEGGKC